MLSPKTKIALFIPCYTEQIFPETGMALARLLRHFGMQPIYVPHQTCCGQPGFNSGYHDLVVPLAERFLRLFEPYDWIVAPSGSCVSMVKVFYGKLDLSEAGKKRWEKVRQHIFEGTEFIYHHLGVKELSGQFGEKVALHFSCHALRELGIWREPEALLRSIKGIQLIIPPGAEECCGFGGTFAVKFPELSSAMGKDKLTAIQSTGAQVITAVDDSCLMHLHSLARRRGWEIRTKHALRIMAEAMGLK